MAAARSFVFVLCLQAGLTTSGTAVAAPPRPLAEMAAALDGAKRSADKKECTFAVEKAECVFSVRTTCTAQLMTYSYVTTFPLKKVDAKKSVVMKDAGGFKGSFGVEVTTDGDVIETVTDQNQKMNGAVVEFALGTTPDDEARAKKFQANLAAAKASCKSAK